MVSGGEIGNNSQSRERLYTALVVRPLATRIASKPKVPVKKKRFVCA
jgi:hypothetical protein